MVLGYTTGVFDLFHIGHLNLLKNARAICDRLIVGVTTDELMLKYKSKKTIIPFEERFEIVRNIRYVDAVVPQETMNKFEAWQKLKFDVMIVGDDWFHTPKWEEFEDQFKSVGVRIVYFPYTHGTSSTLINKILVEERERIDSSQLSQG
jgi:glycerol-3-phosphate cytidylyltransferase